MSHANLIKHVLDGEPLPVAHLNEDEGFIREFMEEFVARVERVVSDLPVITGGGEMTEMELYEAKMRCRNMEREELSYLYTEIESMFAFLRGMDPLRAVTVFGAYFGDSPACGRIFPYIRAQHMTAYAAFMRHVGEHVGEDPAVAAQDT
jgi:hypothetical protein